jgi:hypothetical protein
MIAEAQRRLSWGYSANIIREDLSTEIVSLSPRI